jgi:hypothetical protein
MGHTRMRSAAWALLSLPAGAAFFLLLPASARVLAAETLPVCERLVRTYVMVPVRNRVKKSTAEAWAQWRIGHPEWKPNPKIQRPKYVMTREEALRKVEFACNVPTVPSTTDLFFNPADFPPPLAGGPPIFGGPPGMEGPPIETTDVLFPDLIPPVPIDTPPVTEIPELPGSPDTGTLIPPFFPPVFGGGPGGGGPGGGPPVSSVPGGPGSPGAPVTPPIVVTPEPPSFLLVALGIPASWLFWKRRARVEIARV